MNLNKYLQQQAEKDAEALITEEARKTNYLSLLFIPMECTVKAAF